MGALKMRLNLTKRRTKWYNGKNRWCEKNTKQIEMVNVEQLVPEKHTYRKLKKLLDFTRIAKSVKENVAGKWFCGFSLLEKTPDYITKE